MEVEVSCGARMLNRRRPFRSREQSKAVHVAVLFDAINKSCVDLSAPQRARLASQMYDAGIRVRLEDQT